MKWSSAILVVLLALSVSSLKTEKIRLVEDKPADLIASKPTIRSPLSHLKKVSSIVPSSLGSAVNLMKFKSFFSKVVSEKKEKVWNDFVKASRSNEYLLYLMKKGSVAFSASATLELDEGIDYSDRESYLEHLVEKFGLKEEEQKSFIEEALEASSRDNKDVKQISLMSSEEDGSTKCYMVLFAHDAKADEVDCIIITQTSNFKSYPKVFVVTTEDADSFGEYQWNENEEEEEEKGKDQDVEETNDEEKTKPKPQEPINKKIPEVPPEVDLKVIHQILNFLKISAIEKLGGFLK